MNYRRFLLQGGLGNQLLQAACFLKCYHGFLLDTSLVDSKIFQYLLRQRRVSNYLDLFDFNCPLVTSSRHWSVSACHLALDKIRRKESTFVTNYGHHTETCKFIQNTVTLKRPSTKFNQTQQQDYIAVHIRGGDYLLSRNSYFSKPSANYYKNAIRKLGECEKLIVFTDDAPYAKNLLKDFSARKVSFLTGSTDREDFTMLSTFDRIVCANSTFSLTAALIGKSKFVFPADYYTDGRENPFTGLEKAIYV